MSGHGHHKKKRGAGKQELSIMITTFVVGIFAGFYLYTTAFAPQFDELTGQTEEVYADFVLEGMQYGGDRMGGTAPSFQLLQNGSFRYLPYTSADEVAEAKEGLINRALLKEVEQVLDAEALVIASKPITRDDCTSYVDGRDYTYKVSLDNQDFTLDTCTTALGEGTMMNTTLDKLWNYFENLE